MAEYRKGYRVDPKTGLTKSEESAGLTREQAEAGETVARDEAANDSADKKGLETLLDPNASAADKGAALPVEVKGWNGTVHFDGEAVTIFRKGALARISVGKGEKHIPLASISAVQFKPAGPVVNGFIQFTVGGGIERRSSFGRQTFDASDDENSVVFVYWQRREFEQLRDVIRSAIAAGHRATAGGATVQVTIPQQIEQLAALRDSGALTDAEFEAKKTELLSRM